MNYRLTARSCVELEEKLGTNPVNLFSSMADGSVPKLGDMLTIMQACMTEDVYEWYDAYINDGGDILSLMNLIVDIFKEAGFIPQEKQKKSTKNK